MKSEDGRSKRYKQNKNCILGGLAHNIMERSQIEREYDAAEQQTDFNPFDVHQIHNKAQGNPFNTLVLCKPFRYVTPTGTERKPLPSMMSSHRLKQMLLPTLKTPSNDVRTPMPMNPKDVGGLQS